MLITAQCTVICLRSLRREKILSVLQSASASHTLTNFLGVNFISPRCLKCMCWLSLHQHSYSGSALTLALSYCVHLCTCAAVITVSSQCQWVNFTHFNTDVFLKVILPTKSTSFSVTENSFKVTLILSHPPNRSFKLNAKICWWPTLSSTPHGSVFWFDALYRKDDIICLPKQISFVMWQRYG